MERFSVDWSRRWPGLVDQVQRLASAFHIRRRIDRAVGCVSIGVERNAAINGGLVPVRSGRSTLLEPFSLFITVTRRILCRCRQSQTVHRGTSGLVDECLAPFWKPGLCFRLVAFGSCQHLDWKY